MLHSVWSSLGPSMLPQTVLFHYFMAEWYSIVYVCHILFLYSSVSGHLGCFHVLAIVSSVAVNIVVHVFFLIMAFSRLPRWHSDKESACQAGAAGDMGLIPGSGRSPGEGNSSPLQYSCLENPMNRGACSVAVHRVAKSWTWLIDWACTLDICPAVGLLDHMVTLFFSF